MSRPKMQSIDDALLQQINALTPSVDFDRRPTITKDGTFTS